MSYPILLLGVKILCENYVFYVSIEPVAHHPKADKSAYE